MPFEWRNYENFRYIIRILFLWFNWIYIITVLLVSLPCFDTCTMSWRVVWDLTLPNNLIKINSGPKFMYFSFIWTHIEDDKYLYSLWSLLAEFSHKSRTPNILSSHLKWLSSNETPCAYFQLPFFFFSFHHQNSAPMPGTIQVSGMIFILILILL